MINPADFETRVAALEELLQGKLRVRGKTLGARLHRAGRRLPKRLRQAGRVLTEAQAQLANPRLARMIDPVRVQGAFDDLETFLGPIDPADRRKGAILGWAGGLVLNLMIAGAALVAVLRWRGLV